MATNFTKLFKYMQDEFSKLRRDIQDVSDGVGHVYDLVDVQIKQNEADEQERLAMNRQLDRHEAWTEQASGDLKVSYDPSA